MSNISERLLSIVCRLGASCNRPECPFQHFREVFQGERIDRHKGTVLDVHGDDYFGHYMKNLTKSALSVPDASNVSYKQPSVASAPTNVEKEDSAVQVKSKDTKTLPPVSSTPAIPEEKIAMASQQFSTDAAISRKTASKEQKEPNARIKIRKRLGQTEFFDLQAAKKVKIKANPLSSVASNKKDEGGVSVYLEKPSVSFNFAGAEIEPAVELPGKEQAKSAVSEPFAVSADIDEPKVESSRILEKEFGRKKAENIDFRKVVEETSRPIIAEENTIDVDMSSAAVLKKKIKNNGPQKAGRRIDSDDDEILESNPKQVGAFEAKQAAELELDAKKQQKSLRLASKILLHDSKQDFLLDSSSSEAEEEKTKVVESPKRDKLPIVTQKKLPVWKASRNTAGVISLSSKISKQEKEQNGSKVSNKSSFDFHFDAEGSTSKNKIVVKEDDISKKANPYQLPFQAHLVDVKNSSVSNDWPKQAKMPLARTESTWVQKPRPLPSTKKSNMGRPTKKSQLRVLREKPSTSGCLPINSQNQMVNYQTRQNCVDRLLKAHLSVANSIESQAKEKARHDESNILDSSSTREAYFAALTDRIKRIMEVTVVRP